MAKKSVAPELTGGLYPLPFDHAGKKILTIRESVVVTRALERALIDLIGAKWRWSDLQLFVVSHLKGVVTYEVVWNGDRAGTVKIASKSSENPF